MCDRSMLFKIAIFPHYTYTTDTHTHRCKPHTAWSLNYFIDTRLRGETMTFLDGKNISYECVIQCVVAFNPCFSLICFKPHQEKVLNALQQPEIDKCKLFVVLNLCSFLPFHFCFSSARSVHNLSNSTIDSMNEN